MPRSCEALTRTQKWKHKEGRDSSHSYWSRTHGPRGTTHGTYGRRPWLWMVSRRGDLLPAGCRGSFSRQPRYENGGGGGTERFPQKRVFCLGVSTPRGLYRRRGASRGHPGQPGGCLARPRVGVAPGTLLAPWWWSRLSPLVIPEASCPLIFNIIFAEFFGHFNQPENLKNKNSRKPEAGNWVH